MQRLLLLQLITILLTMSFVVSESAFAQISEETLKFYESEQQTWRKYIAEFKHFSGESNFDVTFYHLDVEINVESPYIRGSVLCQFKATENEVQNIKLNLHRSLSIDSISGNTSDFNCANDSIYITLDGSYQTGTTAEIKIFYQGIPELAGGFKGLHYETHGTNEPVIATLSTPFLAHHWWPCKDGPGDKPDSVYIDITIPDSSVNGIPLIAVSNGVLENITSSNSKKTFHWRERYPVVTYYVMAAISNYKHFRQNYSGNYGESFPIDYYVFNEHLSEAQTGVNRLPEAIDLFSHYFGIYPFSTEKYGMTQLGYYGAIENQTNTIINKMSSNWFGVAVHELAHMWFGDMITCKDWHHGWVNEGFATYCEALWYENTGGKSGYKYAMDSFKWFRGGSVYLYDISDPFNIFISIIYRKGAWVLHMLRGMLGDSVFFKCLYEYANDPRFMYDHASTEDFQTLCENISGTDLNFFFEQWIYDEYYPIYVYSYKQNIQTLETEVWIQQAQSDSGWRPVFEMPVRLKFQFPDGSDTLVSVRNDRITQTFQFTLPKTIIKMEFDPDEWILRRTYQVEYPVDSTSEVVPEEFFLQQNFPNPFNTRTEIKYSLSKESQVVLKIFNILGQEVRALIEEDQTAGLKSVIWDGTDNSGKIVSSGLYIYRLRADDQIISRKMVFLK